MSKADTALAIKAASGVNLNPDDFFQKQLDALLVEAEKGDAGKAEFERLRAEYLGDDQKPIPGTEGDAGEPAHPTALNLAAPESALELGVSTPGEKLDDAQVAGLSTVTVRVNAAMRASSQALYDEVTRSTIGSEPVKVKRTAFVRQKLASGELEEAK